MKTPIVLCSLLLILIVYSCTNNKNLKSINDSQKQKVLKKIHFDINAIDKNGLIGPEDGKRMVAYEFCIPKNETNRHDVLKIDSSLQFYENSRGRIGCMDGYYLCIGNGGTRKVLINLAKLDYIQSIEPFYGE